MKQILHINASYKPAFVYGGPTMSVSILCEHLVKAGLNVTVYTTTANGANELPVTTLPVNIDGVDVMYFKRITKDHTHFSPSLLLRLWKDAKSFDLIHIHAWWNLVSVLSCLIAIMRRVPVLVSPRGMLSAYSFRNKNIQIKTGIHNLLGKHLLKRCHIHVTSLYEYEAIQNLVRPESATIIPNFVKLPPFIAPCKSEDLSVFKLIFLSRIEEKKGLDILITALPMISVPYHLTIAGEGNSAYIDSLKTLAETCKVNDHISWAGFNNETKFDLLQKHDLFILPSHDENFGNVVIESLAAGTAVLISKFVGLADYIIANNLGWVCQPNALSVSQYITKIYTNNRDDLKRIRHDAMPLVYEDFSDNKLTHQYIDMYNMIYKP